MPPRPIMKIPPQSFTDLASQPGQPVYVACVGAWGDWVGRSPRMGIDNRKTLEWLASQPDAGVIVLANTPQQVQLQFYSKEEVLGRPLVTDGPMVPPEVEPDFGDCSVFDPEDYENEGGLMETIATQSGYAGLRHLQKVREDWLMKNKPGTLDQAAKAAGDDQA